MLMCCHACFVRGTGAAAGGGSADAKGQRAQRGGPRKAGEGAQQRARQVARVPASTLHGGDGMLIARLVSYASLHLSAHPPTNNLVRVSSVRVLVAVWGGL